MEAELQQFLTDLDHAIDDVMKTEETNLIKGMLPMFVEQYVYEKYDPVVYSRAMDHGGLSDPQNYKDSYDPNTKTLVVEVVREDTPAELERYGGHAAGVTIADIVEDGGPYRYPPKKNRVGPRPFAKEAEKDFATTGKFEGFLVDGLRARGVDADDSTGFYSGVAEPDGDWGEYDDGDDGLPL